MYDKSCGKQGKVASKKGFLDETPILEEAFYKIHLAL